MTDWLSPRTAPVSLGGRNTTPHSRVLTRESRLRKYDWVLNVAVALLLVLGVLLVWGATYVTKSGLHSNSGLKKDLLNVVIGVGLGVATSLLDYRSLRAYAPVVYVASLFGLLAVLSPLGATINGAKSWIYVGGFSLQPAEFAKIALVVGLAMFLGEKRDGGEQPRDVDVFWSLALAAIPLGLVMLQPDLGTGVVLGFIILAAVAVSGAPTRWIAGIMLLAVLGGFGVVASGRLHGYQKARFEVFFNPQADNYYDKIERDDPDHSQIAIGSGGLFGKGIRNGPLTNSRPPFVHEQQDDFIFSVAGEELGFVGCVGIVALLGVILWRAFRIAGQADDAFGRLMAVAIIAWFSFQAFENIGMCIGIMPVTGLPLPFISYGGSSMFANLVAMGLLQNVHMHSQAA